jgi:hypothetical protein
MWETWTTGSRDWHLGRIVPDEVLYYLNGPAIFTCRIGLLTYVFFKSDEYDEGDYYLAASVTDRELTALKEGRLSVRGALSQPHCWLMQTDFELNVHRYEEKSESEVRAFLPKSGVPLLGSFETAADSINQTDSLFAFKFYGAELSEEGMPFSTFKSIVDNVYGVVRNALTPASLSAGRDRRFMDFPVRQPEFASLLIAIDNPVLDAAQLRARDRTRNLDPDAVVQEAHERGRDFADQVERTIDLAMAGQLPEHYAADNFAFLQQIVNILPASNSEVSKLQFSSNSDRGQVFVEVDAVAGDRIRQSVEIVERRNVYINGVITAVLWNSKTIRIQTDYHREVTCQIGYTLFDELVAADRLKIGTRLGLNGRYTSRDYRDWMKVEGDPIFI